MNEVVCPKCGCKTVVKKGTRKTRFGMVQRYLCKRCSRYFADKPLPRCTYHPRIIYHALNHYNMGCSLQKTRSLVNKQFKINVGKTTIHSWITKYQSICPILSIRKQYKDEGEEYEYTFRTTDPNDDDVFYNIEWGDGEYEDWFGPYNSGEEVVVSHTWGEQDTYIIKARAKDTDNLWGPWGYLEVTMPVNQQSYSFPLLQRLLERFPNAFPILRNLLEL